MIFKVSNIYLYVVYLMTLAETELSSTTHTNVLILEEPCIKFYHNLSTQVELGP
jgi:hypothetical protein